MSYNTVQNKTSVHVCNERIFDRPPFMYKKSIWKKLLWKFEAHIFTLLLAPFTSKLVNYSRHGESLNFQKNSKSTTLSFENSDLSMFKHFERLTVPRIIDQLGHKRCQKKSKDVGCNFL